MSCCLSYIPGYSCLQSKKKNKLVSPENSPNPNTSEIKLRISSFKDNFLGSNCFLISPQYPYSNMPRGFNQRVVKELDLWSEQANSSFRKTRNFHFIAIGQMLHNMNSFFPLDIDPLERQEHAAKGGPLVNFPSVTTPSERSTSIALSSENCAGDRRVRVIFNENLEILALACYSKLRNEGNGFMIDYIVKNPSKVKCKHSKGAATACIRAIAQEAFECYGVKARLCCLAIEQGYPFFKNLHFLPISRILLNHMSMPARKLRHFLDTTNEQTVLLDSSLLESFND